MSKVRELARGVAVSWAGTLASIIAGFLMAPFLIHHLGVAGYGVWILIQSTISYMFLMELGLRATIVRFVARDYANSNHDEVSRIVSAAVWVRFWSGVTVVFLTSTIAGLMPHLFRIPGQYMMAARVGLLIVGLTFAVTLVFSVFASTLMAIGAFGLMAGLELLQIILTTAGLVPVVRAGYGIVGMAYCYFAGVMTVNLATAFICFRMYPQLRLTIRQVPERGLLRALWSVGFYILGYNFAGHLIFSCDNIVVGAFASASAVAYYAVAGRMLEYVRQIAAAILKYFTPLASTFEARKQFDRLRQLQIRGTQLVLLVTLPIVVAVFIRGGTFVGLWIGPDFRRSSTPALKVLAIAAALALPNLGSPSLLIALGKQRWLALLTITEGAMNLILSVILARSMGIVGVALGTAIPAAIMHLFVWPGFACRLLGTPQSLFAREVWLRPLIAVSPFAVTCYFAERYWMPSSLVGFFLEMIVLSPVAALGALTVFWTDAPAVWRYAMRRRQTETVP
jgi:O-antigen/teichoic acid export membrane protein